ncbi:MULTISPECIES: GreA/GreB family elongation factor [Clostridia]|uniref:GreA/GreB family elongation factor n=1 Tax=Clostridia TaxID=186801 RepID=UPI00131442D0|nr:MULTISPECIES: GreA/GreB family elongation factor [Clostridia]
MKNNIQVTKSGYLELQKKLTYLKAVKLQEVNQQVKEGRAFCDFDEDPEFRKSLEEQSVIQAQITELESILDRVEIMEVTKSDVVELGAFVTFKELPDGLEETYQIVSPAEANLQKAHISASSPIGKKLIGRKENDEVLVEIPAGTVKLLITKVH